MTPTYDDEPLPGPGDGYIHLVGVCSEAKMFSDPTLRRWYFDQITGQGPHRREHHIIHFTPFRTSYQML